MSEQETRAVADLFGHRAILDDGEEDLLAHQREHDVGDQLEYVLRAVVELLDLVGHVFHGEEEVRLRDEKTLAEHGLGRDVHELVYGVVAAEHLHERLHRADRASPLAAAEDRRVLGYGARELDERVGVEAYVRRLVGQVSFLRGFEAEIDYFALMVVKYYKFHSGVQSRISPGYNQEVF